MQRLIQNIKERIPFSEEEAHHLERFFHFKTVKKNELLIKKGEIVDTIFYIEKGAVRAYLVDKKEKEHTVQLAISDWWISDLTAFFDQRPARLNVEAISDSELYCISSDDLNQLYDMLPKSERYMRKRIEQGLVESFERIINLLSLSAEERYDWFVENYRNFYDEIPDYQIASYLGVTPQSLSRIRKKKITGKR